MKRIVTIGAVVIILGLIVFQLLNNKEKLDATEVVIDRTQIPVSVNTATVTSGKVKQSISLPATLIPYETADIPAAASGKITSLSIELGSRVFKGQVIGHLDNAELTERLEAVQLSLRRLTEIYERKKTLVEGKATNTNAVTDAQYEMENKKWEVAQLRSQLENTKIVSPIGGIITDKKLTQGEYVSTGSSIAVVISVNQLKAKIYVPEIKIFTLKSNQKLRITSSAYPAQGFEGVINYISPQGDVNHNYLVQVHVSNSNYKLKAGQYVQVHLELTGSDQGLQIPKIALVEGFKDPYVYVVNNKQVVQKRITLGDDCGENVEVISGLAEGQRVVTTGQINLRDGSLVEVSNN